MNDGCEHHWHYARRGTVRYTAPLQWAVVCCKCGVSKFAACDLLFGCGEHRNEVGKPAPVVELFD